MITNCNIKKHKEIKLVIICTILTLLSYVFLGYIENKGVYATQTRESYSAEKIQNYSGYKELIEKLKKDHPTWNFTIFYTGLDWNQVIKNEGTAYHGRNVVPSSWSNAWKCATCGNTPHGGSGWRCASEAAVSYYMDPRNWLNDSYIFEFENLAYNGETQNLDGVKKIIADVKYMQGEKVTYTKTDGTKATLNKGYAEIIMEAAKEAKISPYHLASRIRQEQGTGNTPGTLATGTYKGYVGYYNFLNIKASGSTDSQVIVNGMNYAKRVSEKDGKVAWTDPEISIKAGAKILAKNYINDGQDTLYLQKFDVDNSDGTLYYFQYMQNVAAAASESTRVKSAYEQIGMMNNSIEFIIPVYENMPQDACPKPQEATIVTQNVKVNANKIAVRESPSESGSQIATVNKEEKLLRIEIATTKADSYYWDKVVLSNGMKGYIAHNYIEEIEDITNCNDAVVANTSANLRNGPGLTGTTVITTLTQGQLLTRIETGKYNVDNYIWDRVKLADGRQGYIAQNYIEKSGTTTGTVELIKVICKSGLKVREQAGTDKKVLTYVKNSDILTRTKAAVSTAGGYTWDKIVTADGIEGYIARGNSKEQYIEVITVEKPTEEKPAETTKPTETTTTTKPTETNPTNLNNNFKLENKNLICEPETTVETIKEKNPKATVIIKKADGTAVTTGTIGTGFIITIDKNSYTAVKMGDVSGDGKINSADLLKIQKHLLNASKITNANIISAADVTGDGKINSADLLKIQKHLLNVTKISL